MAVTSKTMESLTPKQWASINEVLDVFDFDKVEDHMQQVNWIWYRSDDEEERVPTQSEIRAALRNMLIRAYDGMNMWKKEEPDLQSPYWTSCGGFTVYVWPNDTCQAYFSVTDWWIDEDLIETL